MEKIESLTDADIAEVHASQIGFSEVQTKIAPLVHIMDAVQSLRWASDDSRERKQATSEFFRGAFGDPLKILAGGEKLEPISAAEQAAIDEMAAGRIASKAQIERAKSAKARSLMLASLETARNLIAQEHFLHWEVAFPGVWRNWQSAAPEGGFDAVIGNPPWDRMKMQEVEWFAARAPVIARQARSADRKRMIAALKEKGDPLAAAYDVASARAEKAMERARASGDYPLLSRGDINLYSLFVERAQALLKPNGIAGLLTPSGILSDHTIGSISETGHSIRSRDPRSRLLQQARRRDSVLSGCLLSI